MWRWPSRWALKLPPFQCRTKDRRRCTLRSRCPHQEIDLLVQRISTFKFSSKPDLCVLRRAARTAERDLSFSPARKWTENVQSDPSNPGPLEQVPSGLFPTVHLKNTQLMLHTVLQYCCNTHIVVILSPALKYSVVLCKYIHVYIFMYSPDQITCILTGQPHSFNSDSDSFMYPQQTNTCFRAWLSAHYVVLLLKKNVAVLQKV